jgi:hypothetical protein
VNEPRLIKLTVHLCATCGEQTIWTAEGPLHESYTTDHLADPGRILTLEWNEGSGAAQLLIDAH